MAAIIAHLQTCGRHIVTVENPIEYRFPDVPGSLVTQQEVGTHVESFKRGLTDALRKRPHVIAIGEIRDKEVGEIAVEASLTGHLVLSTLHTNDAPSTITRLTQMGIEPFLLVAALNVVVAARIRRGRGVEHHP
jgi:type IV pilus assembly protein PilB